MKLISFANATPEQLAIAAKDTGRHERSRRVADAIFNVADDKFTAECRRVLEQVLISAGYKSVDVSNPDFVKASREQPNS